MLQIANKKIMKLSYVRNVQFTRLVKISGQLKEINFRKSNTTDEGIFTVDVIDERQNRIIFYMQKEDQWKLITENLPAWIVNEENNLNEIIKEELLKFPQ